MENNEYFLLNAFTGKGALGNQACVMMVDDLSDREKLQAIAANMNMPATAFLTELEGVYSIRWFAPMAEIMLCGHATLASTWVLSKHLNVSDHIDFNYGGGVITGESNNDSVSITSSQIATQKVDTPEHVSRGLGVEVLDYYTSSDKEVVVLKDANTVANLRPDWDVLRESEIFGYVVTANGTETDCVSRVLLPHLSFLEDQATGSAHFLIAPYWAKKLGKATITAYQASARGGAMRCNVDHDHVTLEARCEIFGKGKYTH